MALLTIGEVATRSRLRPSAIRYYEAQGLLPAAPRRSGKRAYEPSILWRLAVIELAKAAGFNLKEIRAMLSQVGPGRPAPAWKALADGKRGEIDAEIERLTSMKHVLARLTGCTCATLADCGNRFTDARSSLSHDDGPERSRKGRLPARRGAPPW